MSRKDPESHYNLDKLHFLFAIVAIILLIAIGSLFAKDYDRQWKDYQAQFRTLEIEKTRMKQDAESNALESDSEYQSLLEELKHTNASYNDKCAYLDAVKNEIRVLKSENSIVSQSYKLNKTASDVAKYNYEEAIGHHEKNTKELESTYLRLKKKTQQSKRTLEDSDQNIDNKTKLIDACSDELNALLKKRKQAKGKVEILNRKLERIDPGNMTFVNQIANIIRDLPIIDLSNPNYKIEQIVLKDITDDVIFTQIPRVDRCVTCHLGIASPDYKEAPQPFTTHPNLDLYLNNDSPHPIEEFGCTICHGGRGRGTSFTNTVHTPRSEDQKHEWEEKYGWKEFHHWEEPMHPMQYVESGCFKCHSGQASITGAEKLNLGLNLIERAGCYSCHLIKKYKDWPKTGPDLTQLTAKIDKDWAYSWINNPHAFRHNTWMPAYFNQSNNSDSASKLRIEQEIHAIVYYLFEKSKDFQLQKYQIKSDAGHGEELVASAGCFACHQIQPEKSTTSTTRTILRQQHGPNLIGLGTKTSQEWLFNWLKDPNRYHPTTRMPNLRLNDQEAADIVAYLISNKNETFENQTTPPIKEDGVNNIVKDFLLKTETMKDAQAKIEQMGLNDKLFFAGEKLIAHYGCFACHNIDGFETAKPIGTELTEEGQKPVNKLDFGFIHVDHTNNAWFTQKLKDPRIFDKGKIKKPLEKLVMPNFNFSETEIDAIVTALLGFVNDQTVTKKQKPRTPENLYIEKGQKLVRQFNCQGCHIIEGQGGAIQESVKNWLIKFDNRSEAEADASVTSFSPPNLIGEGKKVQSEWLFNFLHKPTPIRPWLKVRMPTYTFNAAHLNTFLKYFAAIDNEEFPYTDKVDTTLTEEEFVAAEKLFSTDYFGCAQCHIVGDQMPSGSPDSWAPDFALVKTRLKPGWIIDWLKNPADLLPGTKMPTYFDRDNFEASGPDDIVDGDENIQIRILRNYLFTLSEPPAADKSKTDE